MVCKTLPYGGAAFFVSPANTLFDFFGSDFGANFCVAINVAAGGWPGGYQLDELFQWKHIILPHVATLTLTSIAVNYCASVCVPLRMLNLFLGHYSITYQLVWRICIVNAKSSYRKTEEANRKWPIGNRMVTWPMTSRDHEKWKIVVVTPIRLEPNIS